MWPDDPPQASPHGCAGGGMGLSQTGVVPVWADGAPGQPLEPGCFKPLLLSEVQI